MNNKAVLRLLYKLGLDLTFWKIAQSKLKTEMDMCFWERLGELHFRLMKMKDVCSIKDKINDSNPKRDELFDFRVYSIYSCHREVHKEYVSTQRIIWLRWGKSSQESMQLVPSCMSLSCQFEVTRSCGMSMTVCRHHNFILLGPAALLFSWVFAFL